SLLLDGGGVLTLAPASGSRVAPGPRTARACTPPAMWAVSCASRLRAAPRSRSPIWTRRASTPTAGPRCCPTAHQPDAWGRVLPGLVAGWGPDRVRRTDSTTGSVGTDALSDRVDPQPGHWPAGGAVRRPDAGCHPPLLAHRWSASPHRPRCVCRQL